MATTVRHAMLSEIPPFGDEPDDMRIAIETPKGSRTTCRNAKASTMHHPQIVTGVAQRVGGRRLRGRQSGASCEQTVAEEVPVGFVYNGFPHAVMMATPSDLDDLAVGFSVTEGLVGDLNGIRSMSSRRISEGIELAIELAPEPFAQFLRRRRVRQLRGHTSCGICGIEEIAQVAQAPAPPTRRVMRQVTVDADAVRRAVVALRDFQPLSWMTRCAHAAALIRPDGSLILVREDVGRHNALDKLIGACLRNAVDTSSGFCLVTSRCSFEMVQKAVAARMPALVAISAPTALAIRAARQAGLTLGALDHDGQAIVYSGFFPQVG